MFAVIWKVCFHIIAVEAIKLDIDWVIVILTDYLFHYEMEMLKTENLLPRKIGDVRVAD